MQILQNNDNPEPSPGGRPAWYISGPRTTPISFLSLSLSPEVASLLCILLISVYVCIHMLTHPTQSTRVHTRLNFIHCVVMCKYLSPHKSSLLFFQHRGIFEVRAPTLGNPLSHCMRDSVRDVPSCLPAQLWIHMYIVADFSPRVKLWQPCVSLLGLINEACSRVSSVVWHILSLSP